MSTRQAAKVNRLIPMLLIAASMALDVVLVSHDSRFPDAQAAMFLGFGFGQLTIVAAWLVFGRLHFLLRLACMFAALFVLTFLLSSVANPNPNELMSLSGLLTAFVALPLLVFRLRGLRIAAPEDPWRDRASLGSWQFTIGSLFVATTSFAVLLAVVRWIEFPREFGVEITTYGLGLSLIAFASLTSVRWKKWWPLCFVGCLAFSTAVGAGLSLVENASLEGALGLSTAAATECATICAAIAIVRVSGYALVWHRA